VGQAGDLEEAAQIEQRRHQPRDMLGRETSAEMRHQVRQQHQVFGLVEHDDVVGGGLECAFDLRHEARQVGLGLGVRITDIPDLAERVGEQRAVLLLDQIGDPLGGDRTHAELEFSALLHPEEE
jgi:hypothetical protein